MAASDEAFETSASITPTSLTDFPEVIKHILSKQYKNVL